MVKRLGSPQRFFGFPSLHFLPLLYFLSEFTRGGKTLRRPLRHGPEAGGLQGGRNIRPMSFRRRRLFRLNLLQRFLHGCR